MQRTYSLGYYHLLRDNTLALTQRFAHKVPLYTGIGYDHQTDVLLLLIRSLS